MRRWPNRRAKGVLVIIGVFGLAPPCTIKGVLIGVGYELLGIAESGVVISLTTSDCILTDLGVANFLGVCLDGVCNMGLLIIFSGDDFPVTLGNLDFD